MGIIVPLLIRPSNPYGGAFVTKWVPAQHQKADQSSPEAEKPIFGI